MSLSQNLKALMNLNLKREEKVLDAIFRSSFLNLIARGFGYAKHLSIAILLGFSSQTDGFFMALSLLGIFLIFADVFDSIGVPQLVRARLEGEEEFKKLAGFLMIFTMLLSFSILSLSLLLMPLILKIPAGFSRDAFQSTETSYLLLIPYVFLNFYFHHFGALLRSIRRFTAYFIGEFIFSISTFLIVTLGLLFLRDYKIIPISLSLAQLLATVYMFYVGKEFLHVRFYLDDQVKKVLNHFLQLSFLYGVFHLYILVDRAFASYLGEKAVSALAYGLLLASIPKGVLKLENIAITSLSEAKGSIEKLNFYIKKIILLILPISVLFFLFSWYLTKLLFGYGAFSHLDIDLTAEAFRFYSLSLPFMFLWPLIYRVFQIRERLNAVSFVAILGVIANGAANYVFVFVLHLGIAGICLGTFFASIIICSTGYQLLRRLNDDQLPIT
ncbi:MULTISPECIES: lipid II flippase MurJ [Thermodesulfovibrio]|uniref:lipid II flippase MurJ n=1 Tax=Thermodesulfovibrio yellowstonii TaxID=28262 RepID=UPI0006868591|nr:lipid II flippase MurJ [Thermodesulfovibrio islandicus]